MDAAVGFGICIFALLMLAWGIGCALGSVKGRD